MVATFIFVQHAKCKQPIILQFARFLAPRVTPYVRLCGRCLNWQNNFLDYGNESEADDNDAMAAHNVVAIVATTATAINDDNDNSNDNNGNEENSDSDDNDNSNKNGNDGNDDDSNDDDDNDRR